MSHFTNPFAANSAVPVFNPSPAHTLSNNGSGSQTLRKSSLTQALAQMGSTTSSNVGAYDGLVSPGGTQQPYHGALGSGTPSSRQTLNSLRRSPASGSSSSSDNSSQSRQADTPTLTFNSRRGSRPGSPAASAPTFSHPAIARIEVNKDAAALDTSRRRSVDVGVLGQGSRRQNGLSGLSRRVREAVGPDSGDKEQGLDGFGNKEGKDSKLGRHLASVLAHSLSLCTSQEDERESQTQCPVSDEGEDDLFPSTHGVLETIEASPVTTASSSRNTSVTASSFSTAPSLPSPHDMDAGCSPSLSSFPVLTEAKRFKMISNLQSWTFNAIGYSSDELLSCVGIMFESVRNMEGVSFDMDQLKSLLVSLRRAYHSQNGYHNFSHATDVTQAIYSFLVRMGLAPPLYLLCEDDYDPITCDGRKWRRNRAVSEGGMGELLRPMDVFALMVAAIGHDVGHPGLSNAYMINARTPVAQVYDDKSVLENFHTVTLIQMLRRHNFGYLLGGEFGYLGDSATSFRKVVEASILATDMSRHFGFVNKLNDMGRRFGEQRDSATQNVEEDRLLLCSGLMKCADISNPTRPHRISRAWSTALLEEWAVQATIEKEFGLPVSVMEIDPLDTKAQAKSQVGFIDLFAKPLYTAMAKVVDEFQDFSEKLTDGRAAWEIIAHADHDTAKGVCATAPPTPIGVRRSQSSEVLRGFAPVRPASLSHRHKSAHAHHRGGSSSDRIAGSPSSRSPTSMNFPTSVSPGVGPAGASYDSSASESISRSPRGAGFIVPEHKNHCGGFCSSVSAMCAACARRKSASHHRRASLGRPSPDLNMTGDPDWPNEDLADAIEQEVEPRLPTWPFLPGVFSPTIVLPAPTQAS